MGTLVDMKEGDNQRDQGESEPRLRKARTLRLSSAGLPPLTLSLRFSPKSVIPLERREEREHC